MAKPFGTLTAIFLALLWFIICEAQGISIPTSRNVSSSPHQDLSAARPYFFGNLTFGEFLAKRALYSKTPFVKRDVVGGETQNHPIINELLQHLHAICNTQQAGFRAGRGSCTFAPTGPSRMSLTCYQWPREGAATITAREICPPNSQCTVFPAWNLLGNSVQFPVCLPTYPVDEPQPAGQPPEQPGQEPDFFEGSYEPIPYQGDDGTYDMFVQAPEGQNLAYIYPPSADTNFFGPSWGCMFCRSGTLSMYHQQSPTFAFTYFSPSS
jgi:hypothetical protein